KHLGSGLYAIRFAQLLVGIPQLLSGTPPEVLIDIGPIVYLLALPLFAVTATRTPGLHLQFHSSRKIVFHVATIIAVGVLLQGAAIAAFYLRRIGGDNGTVFAIVFAFVSAVGLAVIFTSESTLSRMKDFINQNFFSYKYDYRLEWSKFIRALSIW